MGRAVIEGLWLRYQGMPLEEDVGRERRRRVLQTLVWFLLTLLLALFIPDIGKVISVIGGLAACFIFVFQVWTPSDPQLSLADPPGLSSSLAHLWGRIITSIYQSPSGFLGTPV